MIVHCNQCRGTRDVIFNKEDTFTWQCPYCMKRQKHESEVIKTDIWREEDDKPIKKIRRGNTISKY